MQEGGSKQQKKKVCPQTFISVQEHSTQNVLYFFFLSNLIKCPMLHQPPNLLHQRLLLVNTHSWSTGSTVFQTLQHMTPLLTLASMKLHSKSFLLLFHHSPQPYFMFLLSALPLTAYTPWNHRDCGCTGKPMTYPPSIASMTYMFVSSLSRARISKPASWTLHAISPPKARTVVSEVHPTILSAVNGPDLLI